MAVVRIDTVRAPEGAVELQYPGHVVAATEANVSFKVAGTLKRVLVSEGDYVKAGQLIAEIDPVDYKVQLSATEAEYAQIKADAERVMGLSLRRKAGCSRPRGCMSVLPMTWR